MSSHQKMEFSKALLVVKKQFSASGYKFLKLAFALQKVEKR